MLWSPFQPLLDMCTCKLVSGLGQGKEEEKSYLSFHDCMCQKEKSELEELRDETVLAPCVMSICKSLQGAVFQGEVGTALVIKADESQTWCWDLLLICAASVCRLSEKKRSHPNLVSGDCL